MDTVQARDLLKGSKIIFKERGGSKNLIEEEKITSDFAYATVVTIKDIKKGEILSDKNLIALRPATGISISKWDQICKKKAKRDILKNKKLSFSDFC